MLIYRHIVSRSDDFVLVILRLRLPRWDILDFYRMPSIGRPRVMFDFERTEFFPVPSANGDRNVQAFKGDPVERVWFIPSSTRRRGAGLSHEDRSTSSGITRTHVSRISAMEMSGQQQVGFMRIEERNRQRSAAYQLNAFVVGR